MNKKIAKIIDNSNGGGFVDIKSLTEFDLHTNYSLRLLSVKGFMELLYELLAKTDDDIDRRVLDGIVPILSESIDKLEDINTIVDEFFNRLITLSKEGHHEN